MDVRRRSRGSRFPVLLLLSEIQRYVLSGCVSSRKLDEIQGMRVFYGTNKCTVVYRGFRVGELQTEPLVGPGQGKEG